AEGDLQRAEAGGWEPDLVLAQAQLANRIAEVDALKLLIDRLTVRAPRDGTVLRREIEPGEQATPGGASPPMILGDLSGLWVRAQIDEEDIGLVGAVAQAVARTRGAVVVDIPLRLVRIEPYARPKQDLSGSNRERVDTRVIEAVFEMAPGPQTPATPTYPGQAVDVFIESRGRVGG
ncbi:MAG: efflux RND transporter periplasmic adaptor subunit, partial [Phycisphaerales bacterium]